MEEYNPKFISLLQEKGYSIDELPPYIDQRVKHEIANINRILEKYEIHSALGQNKIANNMLEKIEKIDSLICNIIEQAIDAEEELEKKEELQTNNFENFYLLVKKLYEKGEKKIKINLVSKNNLSFSLKKEKDYYTITKI